MTLSRFDKKQIRELIREELSEQNAAHSGDPGRSFEDDADQLASQVASGSDIMYGQKHDLSYRETIEARHGVDPANFDTEGELREALAESRKESV